VLKFVVIIACGSAIQDCPIPDGMKFTLKAPSQEVCLRGVSAAVQSFGVNPKDFSIQCRR
jgi:hypothetical protein